MNNTKVSPVGIDKTIQEIQTKLYESIGWENIEAFGRTYKYEVQNGKVIPVVSTGADYKDVFMNDKFNATIFFIADGDQVPQDSSVTYFLTEVKIVIIVNLKNTYPDIPHRADVEAQQDVLRIVKRFGQFGFKKIETELPRILRGYSHELIKLSDIQPRHIFSIVGNLKYKNNC